MMRAVFERFLFGVVVFFCLHGSAWAGPIRIIVFGDSLTSGYELQKEEAYPAKLEKKLKEIGFEGFEVINMSTPGMTTAMAMERINTILGMHPDIVIVELGANDVLRSINSGIINSNLGYILGRLTQQNIYVILFGIDAPAALGPGYAQQLNEMYQRLASFYKTQYHPSLLQGVMGNAEYNLADGYHPNGKGVDLMVENTYRTVDAALRWRWDMLQQQQYEKQTEAVTQSQEPALVFPDGTAPSAAPH